MAILIQDPEEFENKFFSKIDNFKSSLIQELKREIQESKPEEYLTRLEVSLLLKVHVNTIDDWTKKGSLRKYGVCGSKVIYKRSEIEAAIEPLK